MRNYEATLILSPQASAVEVNDTVQELASLVQGEGGILDEQNVLGKKTLLAPIRNHKEGYVALLSFNLNQEKLPNLEKNLRDRQQILRYLLLLKQPRKMARAQDRPAPKRLETQKELGEETRAEPKKEEKIELKDIDEKLREIFKEEL